MKREVYGTTLLCISMSSIPAMSAYSKVDVLVRGKEDRHSRCYENPRDKFATTWFSASQHASEVRSWFSQTTIGVYWHS